MTNIPFNVIPSDILTPGFFFEVRPLDNTGQLTYQVLLVGQVLSTGSLGPTVVATSAASASGETLNFTSVPSNIVPGMIVRDLTTADTIAAGTTVVSTTGTTVVLSAAVTSGGPSSGDSIQFYPPTAPVLVTTVTQAKQLFGVGSQLAGMVAAYRGIDGFTTLYCLPLIDDPSATAATATINIAGTVSTTSTLYLYVCGVQVPVTVTAAMTNGEIAQAIVSNINANTDLPLTASGSSFPVTLTANNAGLTGNDLDVRYNYYGAANNEFIPTGLVVSPITFTGGAVNPNVTSALGTSGVTPFNVIASPYVDDTNLTAFAAFLDDQTGRWSYLEALYGAYFAVANNTVSALATLTQDQNDQHINIVGSYQSPTPPYALTAMVAANVMTAIQADMGQPFNTMGLTGALPPAQNVAFTLSERQTLLAAGCGTLRVAPGNSYIIDRLVTSYTTNQFSQPDNSYRNSELMFCVAYAVQYANSILSSLYARVKIAADGTRIQANAGLVTPSIIAGTAIQIMGDLVSQGVCQGLDYFTQNLVVNYPGANGTDPNRVDMLWPSQFVGQLDVTGISLQIVAAGTA